MSFEVRVRVSATACEQMRVWEEKGHTFFMRKPRMCFRSSFRASSRSNSACALLRKDRKSLVPRTILDSADDGNALVEHLFLRVV